jgi:predicted transposase/invertase (TIGR01784 family)
METLANKNPDLGKIVGRVMEMSEDEAERMIADAREKARRDKVAEIAYGRNEGIAEGLARGIEKGLAKGKAEGKAEAAIGMKAENIPIETIAKITGLSAQKIKAL